MSLFLEVDVLSAMSLVIGLLLSPADALDRTLIPLFKLALWFTLLLLLSLAYGCYWFLLPGGPWLISSSG